MIEWVFSTKKARGAMWYIIWLIIVLFLVVYGILNGIYILSIVSLLFAGTYIMIDNNSAPTATVQIDESGIRVDESFYAFSDISSFAIVRINDVPTILRINQSKRLAPTIDIPLSYDIDSAVLQEFLALHLTEDKNAKFTNSDALIHLAKL